MTAQTVPSQKSQSKLSSSNKQKSVSSISSATASDSLTITSGLHHPAAATLNATKTRPITYEEVRRHDNLGSAWCVIHNHVYDITSLLQKHPGGPVIKYAAGRDATCLVESYHPHYSTSKIQSLLEKYAVYIGPLSSSAATVVPVPLPDNSFFYDVRQRVEKYLKEHQLNRHSYDYISFTEGIVTLFLYCYVCYLTATTGSFIWAALLGILTGRMGFIQHNGNHCGSARSPLFNMFTGTFMDLIGSSNLVWGYEHQVAHHISPNELHKDNDCEIGDPMLRLHPGLPLKWYHRYQHIIILIGMSTGLLKWVLSDFQHFFNGRVGNVKISCLRPFDVLQLFFFKGLWFYMHLYLPAQYHGWAMSFALMAFSLAIGAYYIESIFIVNHIQDGLVPDERLHWADKQILATSNWSSASHFWGFFSGGLNHQIEHHLFPSLNTYMYPVISPVVKKACEEYGLPYFNYPNFFYAWLDMINYLRKLGRTVDELAVHPIYNYWEKQAMKQSSKKKKAM